MSLLLLFSATSLFSSGESGGPGRIIGTTNREVAQFTRKRWREIQDAEQAAYAAELEARALAEKQKRDIALAAIKSAQSVIVSARLREAEGARKQSLSGLTKSLNAFIDLPDFGNIVSVIKSAEDARRINDDEDETLMMLLAHVWTKSH